MVVGLHDSSTSVYTDQVSGDGSVMLFEDDQSTGKERLSQGQFQRL